MSSSLLGPRRRSISGRRKRDPGALGDDSPEMVLQKHWSRSGRGSYAIRGRTEQDYTQGPEEIHPVLRTRQSVWTKGTKGVPWAEGNIAQCGDEGDEAGWEVGDCAAESWCQQHP